MSSRARARKGSSLRKKRRKKLDAALAPRIISGVPTDGAPFQGGLHLKRGVTPRSNGG